MKTTARLALFSALTLSLFAGSNAAVLAQPPAADVEAQRAEMEKLSFLVGEWEGESWWEMVPGQRAKNLGTETVESRLGGLLLVVEGKHTDPENGKVVHHAVGLLSWDEKAGRYRFQTHLADGRSAEASGRFEDGAFVWGPPAPPGIEIRYTIRETDDGRWHEVGEMSQDGGESWRKIFEMTLQRTGG